MTQRGLFRLSVLASMTAIVGGCVVIGPLIFQAQDSFSLSLAPAGITLLQADWRNGEIKVRVDATASQIQATGTRKVTAASQSAADAALADIKITLAADGADPAKAVLRFAAPETDVPLYSANVEVVIPSGLALNVVSTNGEVTVTGNTGSTTITLENGSATVVGQQGNTAVTVTNGAISIDSTGGDVVAKTTNGEVIVKARPGASGSVAAETDVGTVSIAVPAAFAASLSLETALGAVDANLNGFTVTNLVSQVRKVTATLNGGGGQITGKSSLGGVSFGPLN